MTATKEVNETRELIRKDMGRILAPGQTYEIRVINRRDGTKATKHKLVNNLEDFERIAEEWGKEYKAVYFTLNPVHPETVLPPKKGATDKDILCRRWIPIDIDPVRPTDTSSTYGEHAGAMEKAEEIKAWLDSQGWNVYKSILASSGNGAHLIFRTDLPNNEESTDVIHRFLNMLNSKFSDEKQNVDTTVHNASRIWKAYGTEACKGENTKERPHRRAVIQTVNEGEEVPMEAIQQILSAWETQGKAGGEEPTDGASNDEKWVVKVLRGVTAGGKNGNDGRNSSGIRLAGYLRNLHSQDVTTELMLNWNRVNKPPMETSEVESIIKSAYRYENGEGKIPVKKVVKYPYEPPCFDITLTNDTILRLSAEELFSFYRFEQAFFKTTSTHPPEYKKNEWKRQVKLWVSQAETAEVPDECAPHVYILNLVIDILNAKQEAETAEDFNTGDYVKKGGLVYFKASIMIEKLRERGTFLTTAELHKALKRNFSGFKASKIIRMSNEQTVRAWGIPECF